MKISHMLYALFVAFIWATAYFFQKELVVNVPAYFAISAEAFLIAIILIPFFPKPVVSLKDNLLLSFLWGVLTYGSVLTAAKIGIDASVAVVVGKLNVVFAVILSVLFCREKLKGKAIVGITISFLGLFFLLKTPNVLDNPLALIFMLAFAISWGMYHTYIKFLSMKCAQPINPVALIAWVALLSIPQTLVLSFFFEDWNTILINTSSIVCLLFLAVFGTCISLIIWSFLIQHNPMHKVTPFVLLVPIIGVLEAYYFSDEVITVFHILSASFIVIGLLMTLQGKEKNGLLNKSHSEIL